MSDSLVPQLPASEKPRALTIDPAGVLVPLGLFAAVISVAAPDGSYFPSSWGWASLAFLWAAAIGLIVQKRVTLGAIDVAYLGAWLVLLTWTAASLFWSQTATQTMYEVERTVVYVSFALALAVLARRSLPFLLPTLLAGIVAVASYSLATRLLPDRVGTFNSFAGYRLSEPLGYWNAVSIFVAIGIVVAVGLAARAEAVVVRALSASSLALLVPVLYFTFGRGGWLAIAAGIAAAIIIDPRRLQLAATLLVVAPWPALAVWRAYESPGLTTQFSQLAGASHEGSRLALTIALLAVASAFATAGFTVLARRVTVGRGLRRVFGTALVLVVVGCVVAVVAAYGGPSESARRALDSIKQASPTMSGDRTNRLFSLSSSGRLDTWESALDDYRAHALLGSGAGTFERWWLADRSVGELKVRDAHSLYLETLAELGPLGLAALLVMIVAPLVAAVRARRSPYVAPALAGFVALVAHAGIDWDWEMPAVMIAGLTCAGVLLLADAEHQRGRLTLRGWMRSALIVSVVALAVFSFATLTSNRYLGQASRALDRSETAVAARDARRAERWAPWSTDALEYQADAALADGSFADARRLYRQAIAKDGEDWELWLDLALASNGDARRRALARATALNPLAKAIEQLRTG